MRKYQKLNSKSIERLEKEVVEIKKIQQRITRAYRQLRDKKDKYTWLNYLSSKLQEDLTQDERIRLYELMKTINYCDEF